MTATANSLPRQKQRPAAAQPPLPRMGVSGTPAPRLVDLFCGAGGLSEGFRQAGFDVVAAADHDPDACATYRLNFRDAEVLCGDLRLPALREQLADAAAGVDLIVGGPPCQAYSQVRNHTRLINDPRNSLYREFVRTVGEVKPAAFLMENVPGLAQMGVKKQVVDDLSLDGEYDVTPQLVDAADFGVPQTRERLLFLGVRRALRIPMPRLNGSGATGFVRLDRAQGTTPAYEVGVASGAEAEALAAELADPWSMRAVTVAQAISDLATLASGRRDDTAERAELDPPTSAYQELMRHGLLASSLTNVSVPRIREDTVLRLDKIPAGGNHRDLPDEFRARYLTNTKWGQHSGTGRLERRHYSAYRRLHPELWSWTINTKADCAYHYQHSRSLSVREFARLQSFPDYFKFTTDARQGDDAPGRLPGGATHSRYRQVGNAVPPLLALAAARALQKNVFPAAGRLRTA